MLSNRFSRRNLLGGLIMGAATLSLAACANLPNPRGIADPSYVDPNETIKVALLVPGGTGDPGKEQIARNLVNAAKLAQTGLQNAAIQLDVFDTQGTSAGGAAAAQNAVAAGAKIIVGPLFSTATAGAAPIASAAGVNMISMSNNIEVAGPGVFIIGNTFENTANEIVGYAMSRGLSNFGIVYPAGLEGNAARDAAAAAITRRGAALVGSESYALSVEAINAAAAPAASALKARGANAVILTDGPTGGLGFMAEALRNSGLDAGNAQFLGMQNWAVSQEALLLNGLQGGTFAAPDPALVSAFRGRYTATYGSAPHELAGLAFDGVAAVGALISEARNAGGSPFTMSRITKPAGFIGSSGAFRFFANGHNQRNMAIFSVQGGQAVLVKSAGRGFGSVAN